MIVHISMAKFKESAEGCSKAENMATARALTLGLKEQIPQLAKIEVGFNMLNGATDYDSVSYSEYLNMEDVMTVVRHPAHDALIDFLKKVTESTHAVTFERK